MSKWLNNKAIRKPDTEKPCHQLGWCPYGQLVEEFPLEHDKYSCEVFGHNCPAYYHREDLSE